MVAFLTRRFDAVVFDLDGSIVDTEMVVHQAWAEIYARHGAVFSLEEWSTGVGTQGGFDPLAALLRRATRPLPATTDLVEWVRAREEELLSELNARPGVIEWISAAEEHGLGLAVASSSPEAWVVHRLRALGLREHFQAISTPSNGLPAKPAPDLYLDACRQLGVAPSRALAVEDSPNGIASARAAGLTCIAVPNPITASLDLSRAHLRLASLMERPLEHLLGIERET